MTFLEKIKAALVESDRLNLRDRRGHYASSNLSCLRDQYWSWKGEPPTNPTDYVGAMKMLVGDAVEKAIVGSVMPRLQTMGLRVVGSQVSCGGSNPNWDGYMDAILAAKTEDGKEKFLVVEIKTKSGYGADLFWDNVDPTDEYLIQLGLYLKDAHEKGLTNIGCLFYVLLSDKTFGEIVVVNCKYDDLTKSVVVVNYEKSDGTLGRIDKSYDLTKALKRWEILDKHIAEGVAPKGEYQYKYPITAEVLAEMTDSKLEKMISGLLIPGDWQVKYSRYKNKQLQTDGITPELTEDEIALAKAEYKSRHPRTKKYA